MNVIKLILIIGAIFGIAALGAMPALADTITWNRDGGSNDWHDGDNWDGDTVPGPGDDVVIPTNTPTPYLVVISSQDGACKTLDIAATSRLEITGKTLTLGDSAADTTSNLDRGSPDGTIRFVKTGITPGTLIVHQNVTFTGGGTIEAPSANDAGIIKRPNSENTGGIYISDGVGGATANAVIGNITIYCDVTNDGDRFGVEAAVQTMIFGDSAAGPGFVMQISGAGEFSSFGAGKIQFRIVTFAASAPKWVITAAEIEVTDDAGPNHWKWVPFDIDMVFKGGLLDLQHDFSCLGTLHVTAGEGIPPHTIDVADGKIARWVPKTD